MLLATLLCSTVAMTQADTVTLRDGTAIHSIERIPRELKSDVALVFLPGWMMPGSVWKHQLDGFGSKHRVLALDPRCQGDSTKTPDGNYPARRADDLRQVIERRNVQRFVLVAATSSVVDAVAYAEKFGNDRLAGAWCSCTAWPEPTTPPKASSASSAGPNASRRIGLRRRNRWCALCLPEIRRPTKCAG